MSSPSEHITTTYTGNSKPGSKPGLLATCFLRVVVYRVYFYDTRKGCTDSIGDTFNSLQGGYLLH